MALKPYINSTMCQYDALLNYLSKLLQRCFIRFCLVCVCVFVAISLYFISFCFVLFQLQCRYHLPLSSDITSIYNSIHVLSIWSRTRFPPLSLLFKFVFRGLCIHISTECAFIGKRRLFIVTKNDFWSDEFK